MPSRNEVIGIVVTLVVVGAFFSLTGIMQGPTITGPSGEPLLESFGQTGSTQPTATDPQLTETGEPMFVDGVEVEVVE